MENQVAISIVVAIAEAGLRFTRLLRAFHQWRANPLPKTRISPARSWSSGSQQDIYALLGRQISRTFSHTQLAEMATVDTQANASSKR